MKLTNNIPKNSGFKTPEGYFTSSSTSIKDRIALEKVVGINNSSGFIIPEDYFENNMAITKSRIDLENILEEESKSGFITPDSYFDTTISNINNRIELENKLSNNKDAFDVPKGYFNTLNNRLNIETLSQKQYTETSTPLPKKETKVVQLKKYIAPAIGIAASLLLLVSILLNQNQSTVNTDNIELVAITDYFDTYSETIYDTELEELLTEEDLLSLENDVAIEEDVLIDYLEDRTDSYDYYLQ